MNIEIDSNNCLMTSDFESDIQEIEKVSRHLSGMKRSGEKIIKPYSINSEIGDNFYLLCRDGVFWSVSYFERGQRNWPAFFVQVSDAIEFFLLKVTGNSKMSIAVEGKTNL